MILNMAAGKRHHAAHAQPGSMQHAHTFEAPVLRGYSSMPTLPADHAAVATPFSLAVHSSKETPRQGITPKSVFEWQPGSLPATPTTPNDLLLQDPAGRSSPLEVHASSFPFCIPCFAESM
jgi:hypothetical protein